DPATVLVLARAAVPVVVLVGHSRCADMRRNVALIVAQPPAQTLAIDQQLIELTAQRSLHVVTHEVLVWLAFEDAQIEFLLELLRQRRPVGAYRFQPAEMQSIAAIGAGNQTGVALLAALLRPADGRHQETAKMSFELKFQRARQAELGQQVVAPPAVDALRKHAADGCRGLVAVGLAKPDERRVGVAVDHLVALRFDQLAGSPHDFMATQGDGRSQAWIEEPASAGAEHTVEGVHDDLQCLRKRLVVLALGRFTSLPDALDDRRQAMPRAREPRAT